MLQAIAKKNTKHLDYAVWSAARFEWSSDSYKIDTTNNFAIVELENEEIGKFDAVIVRATCDNCKQKFVVLFVACGQTYTCEYCGHTHDEITKEQADKTGLNWVI